MRDPYWRRARLIRVIDGDTVQVDVSLGFFVTRQTRLRLLGLDTPEMHAKNAATRERAGEATAFTASWLQSHAQHATLGASDLWPLYIRTEKADSFDRFLAEVECHQGHSLNAALLDSGLAVVFMPEKVAT